MSLGVNSSGSWLVRELGDRKPPILEEFLSMLVKPTNIVVQLIFPFTSPPPPHSAPHTLHSALLNHPLSGEFTFHSSMFILYPCHFLSHCGNHTLLQGLDQTLALKYPKSRCSFQPGHSVYPQGSNVPYHTTSYHRLSMSSAPDAVLRSSQALSNIPNMLPTRSIPSISSSFYP